MVRFNLVITLLLMINMAVKAELTNRMFDVRHVGYAEGLSSQRVFSIVEDGDGAMWIATKTGIDRYNGHTVKNYDLPGSFYYGDLAGRRLYLLYDAQQGLFAYDHTGRIYRYSTILDHFEQVLHLGQLIQEEVILNKLCLDSNGTWWMGADKGLYKQEADHHIVLISCEILVKKRSLDWFISSIYCFSRSSKSNDVFKNSRILYSLTTKNRIVRITHT